MAPPWRTFRHAVIRPARSERRGIPSWCRTVSVNICQRPALTRIAWVSRSRRFVRMRREHTGHVQMCPHVTTPIHLLVHAPGFPLASIAGPPSRHAHTPQSRSRCDSVISRKPPLRSKTLATPSSGEQAGRADGANVGKAPLSPDGGAFFYESHGRHTHERHARRHSRFFPRFWGAVTQPANLPRRGRSRWACFLGGVHHKRPRPV